MTYGLATFVSFCASTGMKLLLTFYVGPDTALPLAPAADTLIPALLPCALPLTSALFLPWL